MKPRTKKNPTSSTAKKTDAGLANETPKGSAPSLPPSDLEARVAALEKALMTVLVHLPAAFCEERTGADAKTERLLSRLEDRLAAGATLARLHLPESVYDDVFEEWEALPKGSKERWKDANGKLWERFVSLGLIPAEEARA